MSFSRVLHNRWLKFAFGVTLPIILLLPAHNVLEDRRRTLNHGSEGVYYVAFSPDGSALVSTGEGAKLWNVHTRVLQGTLKTRIVHSVVFSPDGKTLIGSTNDMFTPIVVKVWNVQTRKEMAQWAIPDSHVGSLQRTVFSPDSKMVVSHVIVNSQHSQKIRLWNARKGTLLKELEIHDGVESAGFSRDSKMLAVGSWNGAATLFSIPSGKQLNTLRNMSGHILVALAPNGKMLACREIYNKIKLWDVKTGNLLYTLTGHGDVIKSVAFSPDGKMLASGSADKTIRLWDTNTGKLLRVLKGHKLNVNSLAFSPDGSTLASGSADGTIRLWRLK